MIETLRKAFFSVPKRLVKFGDRLIRQCSAFSYYCGEKHSGALHSLTDTARNRPQYEIFM